MKEKSFYVEKSKELKERVLEIRKEGVSKLEEAITSGNLYNPCPPIEQAMREFVHLVYAYDPNMPLNKESESIMKLAESASSLTFSLHKEEFIQKDFDALLCYLDFFIHYLEDLSD